MTRAYLEDAETPSDPGDDAVPAHHSPVDQSLLPVQVRLHGDTEHREAHAWINEVING